MSKKAKAFLSVLFMSLTLYMMIDSRYVNAFGDYIIEFIGLNTIFSLTTGIIAKNIKANSEEPN